MPFPCGCCGNCSVAAIHVPGWSCSRRCRSSRARCSLLRRGLLGRTLKTGLLSGAASTAEVRNLPKWNHAILGVPAVFRLARCRVIPHSVSGCSQKRLRQHVVCDRACNINGGGKNQFARVSGSYEEERFGARLNPSHRVPLVDSLAWVSRTGQVSPKTLAYTLASVWRHGVGSRTIARAEAHGTDKSGRRPTESARDPGGQTRPGAFLDRTLGECT